MSASSKDTIAWDLLLRAELAEARLATAVAALKNVQALIAEAAMTGFNYKDGDWPERLFASQQVTSAAIRAAKPDDAEPVAYRWKTHKRDVFWTFGFPAPSNAIQVEPLYAASQVSQPDSRSET